MNKNPRQITNLLRVKTRRGDNDVLRPGRPFHQMETLYLNLTKVFARRISTSQPTFQFLGSFDCFHVVQHSVRNILLLNTQRVRLHERICAWSSLVHTSDISTRARSKRKQSTMSPQGLVKIKQQDFFFVSSFVRLMAYAWTTILCL